MNCKIDKNNSYNGNKHCVPLRGNLTKISRNGTIKLLSARQGKMAKIIGEKSGADKGAVKNIKYGNKFYFMYTDTFIGPVVKNGLLYKKNLHKYISNDDNRLDIVIRELAFLRKAQKTTVVPRVFLSELFQKNDTIKLILATGDLTKKGYTNVGKFLDSKKMPGLNFLNTKITNKKEPKLQKHLEYNGYNSNYAAFLHPRFYEKNLEKWYLTNKKFFDHLFIALKSIHELNIFHHDLHAGNVWYNGKKIIFIDFGRASTMKESFEFRKNDPKFIKDEKRLFSKEKNKFKKRMMAEMSKNVLNPSGRHEFFRHDIDDKMMVENFYKNSDYYILVHKFKIFLANKYAMVASKQK